MKSRLLGFTGRLGRHSGVVVAVATMLAAAYGNALAGPIVVTNATVTVLAAGTPPPRPSAQCGRPAGGSAGGYMVCVDPDPIKTGGPAGGDVEIIWTLASSGWSFDKNKGIKIKDQKDWKIKPGSMPTEYTATNKKQSDNNSFSYTYDINVTNGTASSSFDPMIMN